MNKYKYMKYKSKYNRIKQLLSEGGLSEGGFPDGFYYKDDKTKQYKVFKTDDKKFISYYQEMASSIDPDEFTTDMKKPDKEKILLIDSIDTFDEFTNRYGNVTENGKSVYIQWDRVAKNYKGFYLNLENTDLFINRHEHTTYKKNRIQSWWLYEYTMRGVLIFD